MYLVCICFPLQYNYLLQGRKRMSLTGVRSKQGGVSEDVRIASLVFAKIYYSVVAYLNAKMYPLV